MTVWFTVQLDDKPGSLARVATALGERGVNITGIVGIAEDTDGALMLTTQRPRADPRPRSRPSGSPFEEHDTDGGRGRAGCRRCASGLADRGMNVAG